jgi:alkylhydroperoxidase family enzyme
MSRIPYVPATIDQPAEFVDAIRKRRGGTLLNLDRLLLHAPKIAQGWNVFMGTIRTGLSLDPYLGELAMCVIAVINRAEYEFHHHAPIWQSLGGTADQITALRQAGTPTFQANKFDARALAIINLSVDMTRDVQVSDNVFNAARAQLADDQQMVELVTTIGAYNLVSRFLEAFQIDPE